MNNKIVLPIEMTKFASQELENTNFEKVKIYIMHTGENLNGSVFSENSIDCSINTLSNIPILAYVEKTSYDEKDFKGHEMDYDVYEDENGEIKIREYYKEMPIGVIPETNEYFKEEIDGEIYLGCYGYIWKCYSNDAYDILVEDREKEVSMEILIKECSYDRKNRCNINKFEFLGVTVLGAKVPGAMGTECQLSMDFSADSQEYKYFFEAVDKLNKFLKYQGKESVVKVEENKTVEFKEEEVCPDCGENPCICDDKEEEAKCSTEEENKEECSADENNEEFADKEDDDKEDDKADDEEEDVEEDKKKNNSVEENSEEFADKEDDDEEDDKEEDKDEDKDDDQEDKEEEACGDKKKKCSVEEKTEEFALSLNNIFKSLREQLSAYTFTYQSFWGDEFECCKYYVEDLIPENNTVIIYDAEVGEYYGTAYAIDKDTVSCDLNNLSVYIREWRAREEGSSRFSVEEEVIREAVIYNMIAEEYHELKDFKAETLANEEKAEFDAKVNEILAQFDFAEDETKDLVEKVYTKELSLDMFENMLFALEGRKAKAKKENFAKANINNTNSLGVCDVEDKKEEAPRSKYQDIIEQYGKKRK